MVTGSDGLVAKLYDYGLVGTEFASQLEPTSMF